jgi:hypothetical protein
MAGGLSGEVLWQRPGPDSSPAGRSRAIGGNPLHPRDQSVGTRQCRRANPVSLRPKRFPTSNLSEVCQFGDIETDFAVDVLWQRPGSDSSSAGRSRAIGGNPFDPRDQSGAEPEGRTLPSSFLASPMDEASRGLRLSDGRSGAEDVVQRVVEVNCAENAARVAGERVIAGAPTNTLDARSDPPADIVGRRLPRHKADGRGASDCRCTDLHSQRPNRRRIFHNSCTRGAWQKPKQDRTPNT